MKEIILALSWWRYIQILPDFLDLVIVHWVLSSRHHHLTTGVNILSLSVQFMIGIVVDFQLPLEKFLAKCQKSEKIRLKKKINQEKVDKIKNFKYLDGQFTRDDLLGDGCS